MDCRKRGAARRRRPTREVTTPGNICTQTLPAFAATEVVAIIGKVV